MVKYKNKLHPWKYIVVLPVARNPIKISSPNLAQLKPVHEGIRRVLLAQQRSRGGNPHNATPISSHEVGASFERREIVSDNEGLSVLEEMVELGSVGRKVRADVEDLPEDRLNLGDVLADSDPGREALREMGRGRQMVGMRMRFQNPIGLIILTGNVVDNRIRGIRRCLS